MTFAICVEKLLGVILTGSETTSHGTETWMKDRQRKVCIRHIVTKSLMHDLEGSDIRDYIRDTYAASILWGHWVTLHFKTSSLSSLGYYHTRGHLVLFNTTCECVNTHICTRSLCFLFSN